MPLKSPYLNDAVLDVQKHRNNLRPFKPTKKNLLDTETGTNLVTTQSQESVSHEEEEGSTLKEACVAGETVLREEPVLRKTFRAEPGKFSRQPSCHQYRPTCQSCRPF